MTDLPFSYNWLIKKNLHKYPIKTILDLGCGEGRFGKKFNQDNRFEITGIEIFKPYIKKSISTGKYIKVLWGDITKKINLPEKSFDLVICLETIEHLKKTDGLEILKKINTLSKKMIIISCPVGIAAQENYDQNIYQEHLSSWFPNDFLKQGYKVYGVGLKAVYGKHTHVDHKIKIHTAPLYLLSFLANPIANNFPQIACQMIAVKLL